ncbi:MAG: glycosyltransferase family 2 protein [Clostridia bacterium]|nr:glycosyltransferase family 2 protein [Clostridia bacterium]
MPKVLVIIPAYNEQDAILQTVQDIKTNYPQADYVVINDCSRDHTRQVLRENHINHIDLPLNLGIGGGVQTGYKYAVENDYDVAVQFDGDGQHRGDCLEKIVAPILAGEADMCIGSRFISKDKEGFQSTGMRRMGINVISTLIRICTGKHIYDVTSGFRASGKEMTKFFSENYAQDYPEPEAIVSAIVHGYDVKEVPVTMNERATGVSSIRAFKSVYYMIKVSLAVVITSVRLKHSKQNNMKGSGGK